MSEINIKGGQLTDHFNIYEFTETFHKQDDLFIDINFIPFVEILEMFRCWYGRPININSCYRTTESNDYYGGSKNSVHLKSNAVDFNLPKDFYDMDLERKEVFYQNVKKKWSALCELAGFYPQVNFYDTFLHLGISTVKASYLDYRKKWK